MRVVFEAEIPPHKKIFQRVVMTRKNLLSGNFLSWRLFASRDLPLLELSDDCDLREARDRLADLPKIGANDHIITERNDNFLVIVRFCRLVLVA